MNPPFKLSALRFLIVDDDPFMQDALAALLQSLGATQVQVAEDGHAACRLLASGGPWPDVLLCDIFMPEMDGFEFLEKLVQLKYAGQVLLVTGVDARMLQPALTLAQAKGLKVLGTAYKPISRDRLEQLLSPLMPVQA